MCAFKDIDGILAVLSTQLGILDLELHVKTHSSKLNLFVLAPNNGMIFLIPHLYLELHPLHYN